MMLGKTILGVSALILISYGAVCLISPATPAAFAGLIISNGDAFAEVGAMYGGLQTGLGLFFLLAFFETGVLSVRLDRIVFGHWQFSYGAVSIVANDRPDTYCLYLWRTHLRGSHSLRSFHCAKENTE